MEWRRDFEGYRGDPPRAHWPGGARVAISLVVNFEEGAELSIADGDARNESVYEAVEEVRGDIDLCMMSHYEYGTRAGYWRIMEVLDRFAVPATVSCCGRAVERSRHLVQDAFARGHEISAHGYRWTSHAGLTAAEVRADIAATVRAIRDATGEPPVGWHTRSAASRHTRRLLVEQSGFLYDSDAYDDDLPHVVEVDGRPHIVVPYAFDTNDMRFQPGGGFVQAGDFAQYCIAAFDRLRREGERRPKMMSVGLHLRLIGRPARIAGLEMFLDHVRREGGAWICRRRDIAEHWRTLMGLPARAAQPATSSAGMPVA